MRPRDFIVTGKFGEDGAVFVDDAVSDGPSVIALAAAADQHRTIVQLRAALASLGMSERQLAKVLSGADSRAAVDTAGEHLGKRLRGDAWVSLTDLTGWRLVLGSTITLSAVQPSVEVFPEAMVVTPSNWVAGIGKLPAVSPRRDKQSTWQRIAQGLHVWVGGEAAAGRQHLVTHAHLSRRVVDDLLATEPPDRIAIGTSVSGVHVADVAVDDPRREVVRIEVALTPADAAFDVLDRIIERLLQPFLDLTGNGPYTQYVLLVVRDRLDQLLLERVPPLAVTPGERFELGAEHFHAARGAETIPRGPVPTAVDGVCEGVWAPTSGVVVRLFRVDKQRP